MVAMNKRELARAVAVQADVDTRTVAQVIEGFTDVVTAVVLGGVSISGGEGSLSGAFTGVLIMGVLSNGLIIMNVGEYYQLVIKGTVLLCAVGFDRMQRNADRPGAKLSPKNAQKAV